MKHSYTMSSAISFARVSTVNQQKYGLSLAEQQMRITAYALQHNLNIRHRIANVQPARKTNYSGISEAHHLIFADISRFRRDIEQGLRDATELTNRGKILHFVNEELVIQHNDIEQNTENYKQFISGLTAAERESRILSKRIKNIKNYKRSRGEYAGGKLPYGLTVKNIQYINENGILTRIKKYIWDEHEQRVLQFIEKCLNPPYTENDLNQLMSVISPYDDPIELVHYNPDPLDDEPMEHISRVNTQPMPLADIASLLNIYEVPYRGNHGFTSAILRRLRPIAELSQLIIYNEIDAEAELNSMSLAVPEQAPEAQPLDEAPEQAPEAQPLDEAPEQAPEAQPLDEAPEAQAQNDMEIDMESAYDEYQQFLQFLRLKRSRR